MPPLIQMENLSKIYPTLDGEVWALDHIDLTIKKGDYVAIVGQSGSGKSTLMNLLGCLDLPSEGHYLLDGEDISLLSDTQLSAIRNQQIGFIFQGFHLIPTLSALENVELPLIYRGLPRQERQRLSKEALCQVGLSRRLHHRPPQMSGGQQQRVAVARALASRPPLILADEPTGNLDSQSSQETISILKELHSAGHTVVLITHDQKIAQNAHRVLQIEKGRIVRDETLFPARAPAPSAMFSPFPPT